MVLYRTWLLLADVSATGVVVAGCKRPYLPAPKQTCLTFAPHCLRRFRQKDARERAADISCKAVFLFREKLAIAGGVLHSD